MSKQKRPKRTTHDSFFFSKQIANQHKNRINFCIVALEMPESMSDRFLDFKHLYLLNKLIFQQNFFLCFILFCPEF